MSLHTVHTLQRRLYYIHTNSTEKSQFITIDSDNGLIVSLNVHILVLCTISVSNYSTASSCHNFAVDIVHGDVDGAVINSCSQ